jgi:hypothetical protein
LRQEEDLAAPAKFEAAIVGYVLLDELAVIDPSVVAGSLQNQQFAISAFDSSVATNGEVTYA